MESLWSEYAQTQIDAGVRFEEEHPELEPRTKIEEIHAWEDFAIHRFMHWITSAQPETVERTRQDLE